MKNIQAITNTLRPGGFYFIRKALGVLFVLKSVFYQAQIYIAEDAVLYDEGRIFCKKDSVIENYVNEFKGGEELSLYIGDGLLFICEEVCMVEEEMQSTIAKDPQTTAKKQHVSSNKAFIKISGQMRKVQNCNADIKPPAGNSLFIYSHHTQAAIAGFGAGFKGKAVLEEEYKGTKLNRYSFTFLIEVYTFDYVTGAEDIPAFIRPPPLFIV